MWEGILGAATGLAGLGQAASQGSPSLGSVASAAASQAAQNQRAGLIGGGLSMNQAGSISASQQQGMQGGFIPEIWSQQMAASLMQQMQLGTLRDPSTPTWYDFSTPVTSHDGTESNVRHGEEDDHSRRRWADRIRIACGLG